MTDDLEEHPDLKEVGEALDFVDSRANLTYVIPWIITGAEMMEFLDCIRSAHGGNQDSAKRLWQFVITMGAACREVLSKDPDEIRSDPDQ